ncbi:general transcription factor II-I repeat domain-containing protein 2 [Trichonephila clavipes]|nr:general transcription factor II-I repeat domain-containing protein 2 [Trichonephila clavipes]
MRQEELKELKLGMEKQQFKLMFSKVLQESEAVVQASYVLPELIAKHSKPFTEGDLIKKCLIEAVEIVCPGYCQVLPSMRSPSSDDLTDDFVNRNLECVSILLSSIWDSDFHGFGNLGLKRGA